MPTNSGAAAYTIEVIAALVTLRLSPAAEVLADGEVGAAYAQTFIASAGSGNYTYTVTAGRFRQD